MKMYGLQRQAAEIRVLKLQNLKGKICDEIELHSGELIEAKLVKAYEKIESERVSLTSMYSLILIKMYNF